MAEPQTQIHLVECGNFFWKYKTLFLCEIAWPERGASPVPTPPCMLHHFVNQFHNFQKKNHRKGMNSVQTPDREVLVRECNGMDRLMINMFSHMSWHQNLSRNPTQIAAPKRTTNHLTMASKIAKATNLRSRKGFKLAQIWSLDYLLKNGSQDLEKHGKKDW